MSPLVCSPGNELYLCSLYRAKLVLGDINESTAQSVATEIKRAGGWVDYIDRRVSLSPNGSSSEAIGLRCDVTSWEDQVDLFQTAFYTFGSVDVVVREMVHR